MQPKSWEKPTILVQMFTQYPVNVPTAVKRGIYTIHPSLIAKYIGHLTAKDSRRLDKSLREWLEL